MQKFSLYIFVAIFLSLFFPGVSKAYHSTAVPDYVWSESVGYFDMHGVSLTDEGLEGEAYNDNTGFLIFDVARDGDTGFTGYAWSESVGYFDFGNVAIRNGKLYGYAYNDNTGFLNMTEARKETRVSGSLPKNILATAPAPLPQAGYAFMRDLKIGMSGEDVRELQKGFIVNTAPNPGGPGYETNYFGPRTKNALIKFQKAYGITPAEGYFGPITRSVEKQKGFIN